MSRAAWVAVVLGVALSALPFLSLLHAGPRASLPGLAFEDHFERATVGPDYVSTGGPWRIRAGELWGSGARNNPLWLSLPLPRDVAVEFTARSETATGTRPGDVKFEIFGNGRDAASGYVLILGGWGNAVSAITRGDEHGPDRVERGDLRVEPGRTYRMRVERRGNLLRWLVDGEEILAYDDPRPLSGPGHDRFAFSSWDADLFYDDLRVTPLPTSP